MVARLRNCARAPIGPSPSNWVVRVFSRLLWLEVNWDRGEASDVGVVDSDAVVEVDFVFGNSTVELFEGHAGFEARQRRADA